MAQAKPTLTETPNLREVFFSRGFLIPFGATILGTAVILLSIAAVAEVVYAEHYFPKVRVAGIEVGRLTRDQASLVVSGRADQFLATGLTIEAGAEALTIYPEQIDLIIRVDQTLAAGYQIGRRVSPVEAWTERLLALMGQQNLPAEFSLDEAKLRRLISELAQRVDSPQQDATLSISADKVGVIPSRSGQSLSQEGVYLAVLRSIGAFSPVPVKADLATSLPSVSDQDLSTAKTEAEAAIAGPVKLIWKDQSWILEPSDIAGLLITARRENPARLFSIQLGGANFTIGGVKELFQDETVSGQAIIELDLDQAKLDAFINSTLSPAIEQGAIDAKFQYSGGKLEAFTVEREGRSVDRSALKESLMGRLLNPLVREVEIPVKVTAPGATLAQLNDLGIRELLASGTSRYTGSSGVRVQNLSVGAAKIHGTLVPPDGVFSMYQAVGDVTISEGFGIGLAIGAGNRSIPAVGGGICHVSTTLFRAVLNAGLPILERNPHSYRISYYEQDSQPGYDASVFFPTSDFRFKNDTGNWILVQSVNDKVKQVLTFEIYGTSDGRVTEVSKASVYNVTAPGAPVYIEDPNLAVGTTKQVEFAVSGATSVFSRTVTRGGEVINKDTFYSKYVPWKAVYLVGTKEI